MYLCVTFWEAEQRGKLDTRQHFVYECIYQRTLISWRCIRHPHIGLTGINLHTRGVEMSTNMQICMKKKNKCCLCIWLPILNRNEAYVFLTWGKIPANLILFCSPTTSAFFSNGTASQTTKSYSSLLLSWKTSSLGKRTSFVYFLKECIN